MREFGRQIRWKHSIRFEGVSEGEVGSGRADATLGEIDKSMRKRKWAASQDLEVEASGQVHTKEPDSQRMAKNGVSNSPLRAISTERRALLARTNPFSPKKATGFSTGPGTSQRPRLPPTINKTPGTV